MALTVVERHWRAVSLKCFRRVIVLTTLESDPLAIVVQQFKERTALGKELYGQVREEVSGLLNHFIQNRWKEVAPELAAVTESGVCYMYREDISLKVGFGAVSGLELSVGLLEKLAELNAFNMLAHAWLRPAADGRTWSVMVTFKIAYMWTGLEELRQFMYTALTNQEQVLGILYEMLQPFGGQTYWDPNGGKEQLEARGLALAAELGVLT